MKMGTETVRKVICEMFKHFLHAYYSFNAKVHARAHTLMDQVWRELLSGWSLCVEAIHLLSVKKSPAGCSSELSELGRETAPNV